MVPGGDLVNQYITGTVIKELRERNNLTQAELAMQLNVSDKTVSKWENAKGYPDITLLEPIAKVLGVSITELLSGNPVNNMNVSGNMIRSKFYVCPVCGNVIHSMGETVINCHGVQLLPEAAELSDEQHKIFIEKVEDEYFIQVEHDMNKEHYISFLAAVSSDRLQMIKLYPEGAAEARFKISGVKMIYAFCNRDGLFYIDINRHIDGRDKSYDDVEQRRALEAVAKKLLG